MITWEDTQVSNHISVKFVGKILLSLPNWKNTCEFTQLRDQMSVKPLGKVVSYKHMTNHNGKNIQISQQMSSDVTAASSSQWEESKCLLWFYVDDNCCVYLLSFCLITKIIKLVIPEQAFSKSHVASLANNWQNSNCVVLDQLEVLTELFRSPKNT